MFGLIPGFSQAKLAVAAIALVIAFGAGWKVEGWRWSAAELATVQAGVAAYTARASVEAGAAQQVEQKEEQTRVVYQTITKTVDRIVNRPVYRDICLDPDGLRAANAALSGQAAAPAQPDPAVPAPHAP